MSISTYTVVGWFILAKIKDAEKEEYTYICEDTQCYSKHKYTSNDSLYCPYCGTKLARVSTGKRYIDTKQYAQYEVGEMIQESFYKADNRNITTHYWLYNFGNDAVSRTINGEYDLDFLNLSKLKFLTKKEFEEMFSKELNIFKEYYGENNISVVFGIMQYSS